MANKPNQRKAYTAHYKRVERYAALLDSIYAPSAAEFSKLALLVNHDPNKPFSWSNYPQTKRKVDQLLRNMANNIQGVVVSGVTAEWGESNFKNDRLARAVIGIRQFDKDKQGRDIIPERFKPYFNNNADALQSFVGRKQKGLNLSQKVWKLTEQYKSDLELALSVGLSDGKSAAELSRDIRAYLKEPIKLFRRIRNEKGDLQLSQAAKAYRPGAGTYRSSYKNAMRLTRTEINMAYRTADSVRYGQIDFVVGFEVKRSGRGYDCSVCESLAGKYPKDFKFTGWHPHCRCYVIPILKTDDEFWAWDGRGEVPASSINEVKDVPQGLNNFILDNGDRIAKAEKNGTLPYFLRDNKRHMVPLATPLAAPSIIAVSRPLTIAERTVARHAARTPEEISAIQNHWDKGSNTRAVERQLGIEQGEPMTFIDANELRGNINYGKGREYGVNCQSCVVAHEARRRGFDVTAQSNHRIKGSITSDLSYKTEMAWIDPKTGKMPIKAHAGGFDKLDANFRARNKTLKVLSQELNDLTKNVGRYHIDFGWKGSRSGHIITLDRLSDGAIRIYDPQSGKAIFWKDLSKEVSLKYGVGILKVDQLLFDPSIISGIVTKL